MTHSDDWWDDLYRDDEPKQPADEQPEREQRRMVPRFVVFERPDTSSDDRRDARTRAVAFNVAAAGLGWGFGYTQLVRSVIDSVEAEASRRAALVIGIGLVTVTYLADRYVCALLERLLPEPFRIPARFAVRIPLASAVLALLLYAPGYWTTP